MCSFRGFFGTWSYQIGVIFLTDQFDPFDGTRTGTTTQEQSGDENDSKEICHTP